MIDPVRNNAEWCDAFCQTHGISGIFGDDFWSAAHRTPPYYPDAVTLSRTTDADAIVRSIDASAGCSIKDSFAGLDFAPYGFEVLFAAEWIVREPSPSRDSPQWTVVRTPERLLEWEVAFGGDGELFRPELLNDPRITIFADVDDGRIRSGCIANVSGPTVGLSNVFGDYAAAVGCVSGRFPGRTIVGYEQGAELALALREGFTPTGPLRIWNRT